MFCLIYHAPSFFFFLNKQKNFIVSQKPEIKILVDLVPSESRKTVPGFSRGSGGLLVIFGITALLFIWHSPYMSICLQISPFLRTSVILD